ncbi:hypothetical protein ACFFRR_000952 [Megaselia abdita]
MVLIWMLSDKFSLSLRNGGIQKKLLDEPLSKSFENICREGLSMDMISQNVNDMMISNLGFNKGEHLQIVGGNRGKKYEKL